MSTMAFCLSPNDTFAQETIFLGENQELTPDQVFDILKKQTDYNFVYPKKLFLNSSKIKVEKGETRVSNLLNKILSEHRLTFKITNGKTVLLVKDNDSPNSGNIQQGFQVSGTVVDELGSPLPGANIVEKGTTNGIQADFDGNFTLNVTDENAILLVSYIGFITEEVPVEGQESLTVVLQENADKLDEVVVIGYGTQRKSDVTGSVVQVDLEAVENAPNTNVGQMLQGMAPGVNVGLITTAGGTPTIQVRGRSSLNGNQNVLIVLDGIPYTGSLSSINPDDIASMEILKDASATAVYGAQGANGVLLITTKKGRTGEPKITYSTSYSLQSPTKTFRSLNRAEYLEELRYENWDLAFLAPGYTTPNPDYDPREVLDASMVNVNRTEILPNDYDWVGEGTTNPFIQQHNLSVSGGLKDVVSYLFSASTVDQQNLIKGDNFNRKTLRANLEITATDFLKVGLESSGSFVKQDGAQPHLYWLINMSPLLVPYDENGDIIPNPAQDVNPNPFQYNLVDDLDRNQDYFANVYAELKVPFIKGLKYRVNYANHLNQRQHYYSSEYDAGLDGLAYKENNQFYDYTIDNIVTYDATFGKHKFTLTGLYGASERRAEGTYAEGRGFNRMDLGYNNLESANIFYISSAVTFLPISDDPTGRTSYVRDPSSAWSESLNYQMGRLSYSYADKYLLTATVRRDGYSGFAENNKYGVFLLPL